METGLSLKYREREFMKRACQSFVALWLLLSSVAAAATGDPLAIEVIGGTVTTLSGYSPNVNGCCVRVKFEGMGRRNCITDAVAVVTSLSLTVQDPGFDNTLAAVTRTRTVTGTLPLKEPFPKTWTSIGLGNAVAANTYCSNGNRAFYTSAGGSRGSTAPTHTTVGQVVSDGGVSWECMQATTTTAPFTGYVEAIDGSDVWVYAMVDNPIYAGSTVTAAAIGAGAYVVGAQSSNASASIASITNSSTLTYEPVQAIYLSVPHALSTGSLTIEAQADHAWGCKIGGGQQIAGAKFQAWDSARANSSSVVSVTTSSLSTLITTASPGGCAVEVYSATINTSGMPAGDSFVEAEFYPWLGTVWRTRYDAEGADWQASTAYPYAGVLVRNGSNLYVCTTAGTSASSGGPTGTGTGIADGSVVWSYFGADLTKQNSRNIPSRWHFYNDPSSVYKTGYCFVDPSGTATGTTGVFATFAEADAAKGTLSNCYSTIQLAGAALVTYNNTSGGGLTTHNDPGNGKIYLKAGTTSGFGASMQSLTIPSVWLYVLADPGASAGTVIMSAGANKICSKRIWIGEGITFTASATGTANILVDPASDGTTSQIQPVTEIVVSGMTLNQFDATQEVCNRAGVSWYLRNAITGGFVVNNQNTRSHNALLAGCSLAGTLSLKPSNFIGNTITGTNVIRDPRAAGALPPMFYKLVDNQIYGLVTTTSGCLISLYNTGGTDDYPRLGTTVAGNLIKAPAPEGDDKAWQIAADGSTRACSNVVISCNTVAGARANGPYNDTDSLVKTSVHSSSNVYYSNNWVYDTSNHSGNLPDGVRCQNYWSVYKVGHSQNCNFVGSQQGGALTPQTYGGLRSGNNSKWNSVALASVKTQFVDDTSSTGTTPSNLPGDFHPVAGAEMIGMATIQGRRYALDGATRTASGAVGAYEYLSGGGLQTILRLIGSDILFQQD